MLGFISCQIYEVLYVKLVDVSIFVLDICSMG